MSQSKSFHQKPLFSYLFHFEAIISICTQMMPGKGRICEKPNKIVKSKVILIQLPKCVTSFMYVPKFRRHLKFVMIWRNAKSLVSTISGPVPILMTSLKHKRYKTLNTLSCQLLPMLVQIVTHIFP